MLSDEKKLIILLNRITFSDNDKIEIRTILENNRINRFEFYKYAFYYVATSER